MPGVSGAEPPARGRNENAAIERITQRVRAGERSEELVREVLTTGERWRRLAAAAETLPERTRADNLAGRLRRLVDVLGAKTAGRGQRSP
jgi:hypothetical protein